MWLHAELGYPSPSFTSTSTSVSQPKELPNSSSTQIQCTTEKEDSNRISNPAVPTAGTPSARTVIPPLSDKAVVVTPVKPTAAPLTSFRTPSRKKLVPKKPTSSSAASSAASSVTELKHPEVTATVTSAVLGTSFSKKEDVEGPASSSDAAPVSSDKKPAIAALKAPSKETPVLLPKKSTATTPSPSVEATQGFPTVSYEQKAPLPGLTSFSGIKSSVAMPQHEADVSAVSSNNMPTASPTTPASDLILDNIDKDLQAIRRDVGDLAIEVRDIEEIQSRLEQNQKETKATVDQIHHMLTKLVGAEGSGSQVLQDRVNAVELERSNVQKSLSKIEQRVEGIHNNVGSLTDATARAKSARSDVDDSPKEATLTENVVSKDVNNDSIAPLAAQPFSTSTQKSALKQPVESQDRATIAQQNSKQKRIVTFAPIPAADPNPPKQSVTIEALPCSAPKLSRREYDSEYIYVCNGKLHLEDSQLVVRDGSLWLKDSTTEADGVKDLDVVENVRICLWKLNATTYDAMQMAKKLKDILIFGQMWNSTWSNKKLPKLFRDVAKKHVYPACQSLLKDNRWLIHADVDMLYERMMSLFRGAQAFVQIPSTKQLLPDITTKPAAQAQRNLEKYFEILHPYLSFFMQMSKFIEDEELRTELQRVFDIEMKRHDKPFHKACKHFGWDFYVSASHVIIVKRH